MSSRGSWLSFWVSSYLKPASFNILHTCQTAPILTSHPFCDVRGLWKVRLPSLRKIQLLTSMPALSPLSHMRTVTTKWVKQFFKWGRMHVAVKTVKQLFDLLHKHTSCNISPKFPETSIKENYIVGNFMVIVQSERNIVILRSRLNLYMPPYFLLQSNEGRAVFLTLRNKTCSYSVTHHLHNQANFHCILCHRGQMDICELVEKAGSTLFVPLIHIWNVFLLCSDRKLVVHELRLNLYIIFAEKFPGALQEVWRTIYCHSLLILKFEEWLPSGSTQQLQSLDVICTSVKDSGNNLQSSILACTKNLLLEFHQEVSLSASTYEVVSNWLLPFSMQTMDHEN